jgi:hypothetical protein
MRVLKRGLLWSIAIYKEEAVFSFENELSNQIIVFNNRKIRKSRTHTHTTADPFLFVEGDDLFLFYECQNVNEKGHIRVKKTNDLINFNDLGCILKEEFHLSYPFVFRHKSSIFMVPESINANEIILYKFSDFPIKLEKQKTLLVGKYCDSSLFYYNEIWYLFTTSNQGFEIYYSKDIENYSFVPHPSNPISNNPKFQRNGGSILVINNDLFRIAQDCSGDYGKNVHIFKILELTTTNYRELLIRENYFDHNQEFNMKGAHHINMVDYKGYKIIAVDGKHEDYLINKFLSPFFRL